MKNLTATILLLIIFSACQQKAKITPSESVAQYDEMVKVYTTAHHTNLKLALTDSIKFGDFQQPLETESSIMVNPRNQFQTFFGIGAALTDASAETFYKLPKAQQEKLLEAYFNQEKGIGYTLARTIIHSCDFSSASYTYIDEGDAELKTFNIEHDKQFRIPFTKEVIAAAGGKLNIFASPWSPPAFMKTNNNMLQGGKLKTEFYQAW
ncbi:MAG: glycosyl hydrolase, partial [Flavobacteriaceae bacterium]|nr:glycosyl hydrolase [Flavobacteriaceae bacterium]